MKKLMMIVLLSTTVMVSCKKEKMPEPQEENKKVGHLEGSEQNPNSDMTKPKLERLKP